MGFCFQRIGHGYGWVVQEWELFGKIMISCFGDVNSITPAALVLEKERILNLDPRRASR